MAKTTEQLLQQAVQIRDEQANKKNTALRVGTLFSDIIEKQEESDQTHASDVTKINESINENKEKLTELENSADLFSEVGIINTSGVPVTSLTTFVHTPYIPINGDIVANAYDGGTTNNYRAVHFYRKDNSYIGASNPIADSASVSLIKIDKDSIPEGAYYYRLNGLPNVGCYVQLGVLGGAVKEQYNQELHLRSLDKKADNQEEKFSAVTSVAYFAEVADNSFNTNGYITAAGVSSSNFIQVREGDIVFLNAQTSYGKNTLLGYENANFQSPVTLLSEAKTEYINEKVIIPNEVNYIMFQGRTENNPNVFIYSNANKQTESVEKRTYKIIDCPITDISAYCNSTTGKFAELVNCEFSGYIPVKSGETYIFSGNCRSNIGVSGWNKDKSVLTHIISDSSEAMYRYSGYAENVEFVIPDGIDFIVACSRDKDVNRMRIAKKLYCNEQSDKILSPMMFGHNYGYALNTATGAEYLFKGGDLSDYIKVSEGDVIIINGKFGSQSGVAGYDINKAYTARLSDSSLQTAYPLQVSSGSAIVIPSGIDYIRAATTDATNNPLKVWKQVSLQDFLDSIINPNKANIIVWFGDSISQLGSIPHSVGLQIGSTVIDCSFAGASIVRHPDSSLLGQSLEILGEQIISKDFSRLDTSLDEQEQAGQDVSGKRQNAENLKSVDFNNVTTVVIFEGTNDLSFSSQSVETIQNALRSFIDNLYSKYPHLSFYFISPPFRGNTLNETSGLDLEKDIIPGLDEVCYEYNIPFLDFFHTCGVNANNKAYFLDSQELHPKIVGERLWAQKISRWLNSI